MREGSGRKLRGEMEGVSSPARRAEQVERERSGRGVDRMPLAWSALHPDAPSSVRALLLFRWAKAFRHLDKGRRDWGCRLLLWIAV